MQLAPLTTDDSPVGTIHRATTPDGFVLFYTGVDFDGRLGAESVERIIATMAKVGGSPAALTTCHQVHGVGVAAFRQSEGWCEEASCDALWSASHRSALAIKVADCLPVTLFDSGAMTFANIHSGWRGSAAKIVEATIREVEAHSHFSPARAHVWLGPSIRQCCFQVGEEVIDAFSAAFGDVSSFVDRTRGERPYLDLVGVTGAALERLGFASGAILDSGICTRCDTRFHSYRRDSGQSGRNLAIAALM
jgi:YfiH family protein